jgi:hypothetical protein
MGLNMGNDEARLEALLNIAELYLELENLDKSTSSSTNSHITNALATHASQNKSLLSSAAKSKDISEKISNILKNACESMQERTALERKAIQVLNEIIKKDAFLIGLNELNLSKTNQKLNEQIIEYKKNLIKSFEQKNSLIESLVNLNTKYSVQDQIIRILKKMNPSLMLDNLSDLNAEVLVSMMELSGKIAETKRLVDACSSTLEMLDSQEKFKIKLPEEMKAIKTIFDTIKEYPDSDFSVVKSKDGAALVIDSKFVAKHADNLGVTVDKAKSRDTSVDFDNVEHVLDELNKLNELYEHIVDKCNNERMSIAFKFASEKQGVVNGELNDHYRAIKELRKNSANKFPEEYLELKRRLEIKIGKLEQQSAIVQMSFNAYKENLVKEKTKMSGEWQACLSYLEKIFKNEINKDNYGELSKEIYANLYNITTFISKLDKNSMIKENKDNIKILFDYLYGAKNKLDQLATALSKKAGPNV